MTYQRPGIGTHHINDTGSPILHNAPVAIHGDVGVAVKQGARHWHEALTNPERIETSERFWLIKKGIVQVNTVAGFAKGDAVYINAGALTETAAGGTKFGRVVESVGDGRGVPTGKVRIDLDAKDSF